ncbi:MAG: class I SAM-dependent methyltransferase [Nitrospira sp.]|nr:class I SAM-dependent methyltransferase [Nitrospira sp.]
MMCFSNDDHGIGYFEQKREDVAALVPQECRTILDVGCGYGALGRTLMARQPCEVDGIELNPDAEIHLKHQYRRVWIGNVEEPTLVEEGCRYDGLLLPDVLEHLVDPWSTFRRLCCLLKSGGVVVASIPNVQNLALLYNLVVRGEWKYKSSGLLDHGHLRFFTRRSIVELFSANGLRIEIWRCNRDRYQGARRLLVWPLLQVMPDLGVCQYLVRARKP